MITFTLYSRSYCHLCDDMLEQLRHSLMNPEQFAISVVDVDADPLLLAQYDELVPVLIGQKHGGAAQKICHYFLDKQALDAFLKD